MTHQNLITHWQNGARDALRIARLCHREGVYDLSLFHCHLAVEKALKAIFVKKDEGGLPKTHRLLEIAHSLDMDWTGEEFRALAELTDFAVEARYADPERIKEIATESNCDRWIRETETILSKLIS